MRKIGNLQLDNPFLLAPMAGITDGATRSLAKEQGAALVYSEMVSGKGLWYKDKNTDKLLKPYPNEEPIAYQLFGSDPEIFAFAARELQDRNNAILDINMGCPVPKIVKNGEGSALLKNPDLIYRIVKAAVDNTTKPVTAKIRIGWNQDSINPVETAQAIEAAGAAAVGVHGRTRQQYYTGKADWSQIKAVKKVVNIPVIGNGDIFAAEDALNMMEETGCDMVMIARGALGNPWIFRDAIALWQGQPKPSPPSREEKAQAIRIHLMRIIEEKGEYIALREMRKHIGWYTKGIPGAAAFRRQVNQLTTLQDIHQAIDHYL